MCIDDEPNITFLLRALLEEAGFQVRIFNQSINAIRFLGMEAALNGGDGKSLADASAPPSRRPRRPR